MSEDDWRQPSRSMDASGSPDTAEAVVEQDDAIVERVARALFDREWAGASEWEVECGVGSDAEQFWRESARAALAAITESDGQTVISVEGDR